MRLLSACVLFLLMLAPAAHAAARLAPQPALLLPAGTVDAATCDAQRTTQAHALLIGVQQYAAANLTLASPSNDVELLGKALATLGAKVHPLAGRVSRDEFISRTRTVVGELGCGDTLLLYFGGQARVDTPRRNLLMFSDAPLTLPPTFAQTPFASTGGHDATGSRVVAPGVMDSEEVVVLARSLSERGVNFVLVLDAFSPPELPAAILDSGEPWLWRAWDDQAVPRPRVPLRGTRTVLASQSSREIRAPGDRRMHGAFTHALATALLEDGPAGGLRLLAPATARRLEALSGGRRRGQGPLFGSTDPDRPLLGTASPTSPAR